MASTATAKPAHVGARLVEQVRDRGHVEKDSEHRQLGRDAAEQQRDCS